MRDIPTLLIGASIGIALILFFQNWGVSIEGVLAALAYFAMTFFAIIIVSWLAFRHTLRKLGAQTRGSIRSLLSDLSRNPQKYSDPEYRNESLWPKLPDVVRLVGSYVTFGSSIGITVALLTNVLLLATLSVQYLQADRLQSQILQIGTQNEKITTQNQLIRETTKVTLARYFQEEIDDLDSLVRDAKAASKALKIDESSGAHLGSIALSWGGGDAGYKLEGITEKYVDPQLLHGDVINKLGFANFYSFKEMIAYKLSKSKIPNRSERIEDEICKVFFLKREKCSKLKNSSYSFLFNRSGIVDLNFANIEKYRNKSPDEDFRGILSSVLFQSLIYSHEISNIIKNGFEKNNILRDVSLNEKHSYFHDCKIRETDSNLITINISSMEKIFSRADSIVGEDLKSLKNYIGDNKLTATEYRAIGFMLFDPRLEKWLKNIGSQHSNSLTLDSLITGFAEHLHAAAAAIEDVAAKCSKERRRMATWLSELKFDANEKRASNGRSEN